MTYTGGMRRRLTLATIAATLAIPGVVWLVTAPADANVACPPGQIAEQCLIMTDTGTAHNGQVIMDNPGADPGTPWMVTDSNGAPMAWVNLYGFFSGGDGGRMPGGDVCVTYGVMASVACLTPEGTLTLQATGPNGRSGPVETLTARDLAWIHARDGGN